MASNLRVRFRERQRKHMSESITVNPTPSKRACPKPAPTPMPVLVPPATIATATPKSDEKLPFVDDIAYHEPRIPFYMASSHSCPKPTYVPSRKEVSKLLRQIPFFIKKETPIQNMGVLFPTIQRIPVEIDNDPNQSFTAQFSYGTPDSIISRIMPM
ncbi:hypothetical protein PVL29_001122 [Vitis rotundifolia]|uniref:Uncharacterized protein n=1 Tax=Vitis rotundifolia TaxID=103349 RepID=A0AA39AM06_VITRO|nr:hypothetical protein PVL29_001122 [Vitis rotundifolia]